MTRGQIDLRDYDSSARALAGVLLRVKFLEKDVLADIRRGELVMAASTDDVGVRREVLEDFQKASTPWAKPEMDILTQMALYYIHVEPEALRKHGIPL